MANQWFRLYSRIMTDPAIEFLSFEDQRHFVWLLCLKNDGVLDKKYPEEDMLDKVVARKLGLQGEAFQNCKERLLRNNLVTNKWQPKKWNALQFKTDSSKERVKKHRLKKKKDEEMEHDCNVTETLHVTSPDTEQNRAEKINKKLPLFVLAAWNSFAESSGHPKALTMSDGRKKHLRARVKLDLVRGQVDFWESLFDFAGTQKGLEGKDWFGLDWILKSEENLLKLMEGKYAKPFE